MIVWPDHSGWHGLGFGYALGWLRSDPGAGKVKRADGSRLREARVTEGRRTKAKGDDQCCARRGRQKERKERTAGAGLGVADGHQNMSGTVLLF